MFAKPKQCCTIYYCACAITSTSKQEHLYIWFICDFHQLKSSPCMDHIMQMGNNHRAMTHGYDSSMAEHDDSAKLPWLSLTSSYLTTKQPAASIYQMSFVYKCYGQYYSGFFHLIRTPGSWTMKIIHKTTLTFTYTIILFQSIVPNTKHFTWEVMIHSTLDIIAMQEIFLLAAMLSWLLHA